MIFNHPTFTRSDDREDYGELRKITIGRLSTQVVVVVVHTDRSGVTRIISARIANRIERKAYNDSCQKIN